MGKSAVEHLFTGDTVAYTAYDSTKTVLGKFIQQKTGAGAADKFAGPSPIILGRPSEASTAIAVAYPHVIEISSQYNWIFLAENSTAAATRRIVRYTHDKINGTLTWNGFITLTYPTATNHTIRALRVIREVYSTGTVAVSGTAVTGTTTAWTTQKIAVGARIGFGSTDPTQISSWYYISAIGSNTGITLTGSAGTISAGTAYVIEELRVLTATTNATATNGGMYLAKGVNADDFGSGGTTIAAAAATDNLKAVYWLADAATVLNTAAGGLGMMDATDVNTHVVYCLNVDGASSARIYKYNIRATLSGLASGKSVSAFTLRTGAQAVTGTISQTNNSRMANCSHGPGSGVNCLYFATTTRICRVIESNITDASTTFVADAMVEIPTGGVNTFAATGALSSVEYTNSVDRFLITTGAAKMYLTQYNTNSTPIDITFGAHTFQIDQTTADANITPHPSLSVAYSAWIEGGMAYLCKNGTTAILNTIYTLPISMHWDFASASDIGRLVTPSLATTGANKFYRVYINERTLVGSDSLGLSTEPYRIYARTSGISDDSGGWTLINAGDLTSFSGSDVIQFMFEFRILGQMCIPARIHGLTVVYEDDSTDSHYQPSVANSDIANKRFAWRFSTAFGSTVPALRVRLYNAATGGSLVDDNTSSPTGTFERSTNDGGAWSAWNDTDKGNETTYLRYTPASLGDNIKVRALLTQL